MLATDFIELIVSDRYFRDSEEFILRVHQSIDSKFKRMKAICSEKFGFPPNFLRFIYDGRRIGDGETPYELEMEQGDVIDVFMPQMSTNLVIKVAGKSVPGPWPSYCERDYGGNMWVHKEVLAHKSPVLFSMFQADPGMAILDFGNLSPDTVRLILDHIYNVQLDADDLASTELLSAAAQLELVALMTKCEEVLSNNISIENCTKVMLVADQINNSRLRDACLQFGIMNMNRISGKSSKLCSSSTMMLLQSFAKNRSRKSLKGNTATQPQYSPQYSQDDENAGSEGQQPVDDRSDIEDMVQMEMEDVDTDVGAMGALDEAEGAGDTDQEGEDSEDEASDRRNERLLLQVCCWVTFNLNRFLYGDFRDMIIIMNRKIILHIFFNRCKSRCRNWTSGSRGSWRCLPPGRSSG